MTFNSRLFIDLHGDQGMDPEPIDDYADLHTRHAAMVRRAYTHAEPMLRRPELAEVQHLLSVARKHVVMRYSQDKQGYPLAREYYRAACAVVRFGRRERRALAAKLGKEGKA